MDVSPMNPAGAAGDSAPTAASATAPGVVISGLTLADLADVTRLHEVVFGPGRYARTAYRVREGAPPLSPACCKLVIDGQIEGAVQMTWSEVGDGARGMLLGPLVVAAVHANQGHGMALIAAASARAEAIGAGFIILVGDLPYYEKSGFQRVPEGSIVLPGPVDAQRLLIRMPGEGTELPVGTLRAIAEP